MPNLLDGSRAKLDRAQETLNNLSIEIGAYELQNPKPFNVSKEHRGSEFVFVASGIIAAPLRFAVLAGEIVHHSRSALDHLVSALVIQNGGQPTLLHQFPICTTQDSFDKACNQGQIGGVSLSAETLIRSVQPYTSQTPDDTVLEVVRQYDNADKHRLLVVVNNAAVIGHTITIGDSETPKPDDGKPTAIIGLTAPGPKPISPEGEVVFSIQVEEPAPHIVADADVVPVVVFEKCGRVERTPVASTLQALLQGVRHTVDSFENEF